MILLFLPMSKVKRIVFFWLPAVAWMSLIYFLSSFHKLQASPVGWQDFVTRKFAHLTEYFILCFLFYRGLRNTTKISLGQSLILSLILTILYALTDEYHQTFVSGRTGKALDIGIDSLGAFLGLIFSWKAVLLIPDKFRRIVL